MAGYPQTFASYPYTSGPPASGILDGPPSVCFGRNGNISATWLAVGPPGFAPALGWEEQRTEQGQVTDPTFSHSD